MLLRRILTKAASARVVITAALTASTLAGAFFGAGGAIASTPELCIVSTCHPYGSVPTGYPLTIPYHDGSMRYVLQVTKNKNLAPKGWTSASFAPFGKFGTPTPTTAATSISIPQFDAAGQATCIDFTYMSGGTAHGIFIISSAAAPG
jgi:NAD(P)H-dependent flavin oxidoreductase YrpB (nitropropane dioxygenase family)